MVDKEWPPSHSFVDGFICNPKLKEVIEPELVITRSEEREDLVEYRGINCWRNLSRRRGIGRVLRFFEAFFFLLRHSSDCQVVFVRNDPMLLAAACILRCLNIIHRLIYQNSYPHEETRPLLGAVARGIFRACIPRCDLVYVVSDKAKARIRRYAETVTLRTIPLLVQDDMFINRDESYVNRAGAIRYTYIGTLSHRRRLDFVIECFYHAYEKGLRFVLEIVGGEEEDVKALRSLHYSKTLMDVGCLAFIGKVPRNDVSRYLQESDVGVSIIPATQVYLESSPTKLGEYLAHGLPVLMTKGIEFQDRIAAESGACFCCNYEGNEIVEMISKINALGRERLYEIGNVGARYARENMSYSAIIDQIKDDFVISR